MPERHLPVRPDLDQLKHQAKDLLAALRRGDATAVAELDRQHPRRPAPAAARLADAQLALARSYGLPSWTRLVLACRMTDAIWRDDRSAVSDLIKRHPALLSEDARLLQDTSTIRRLIVANKCDLASGSSTGTIALPGEQVCRVSAVTLEGLESLRAGIVAALGVGESPRDSAAISNVRHIDLLRRARAHLGEARTAASATTPEEFVLTDLQAARACLDEIVGVRTSEDVLQQVFSRFCIGK